MQTKILQFPLLIVVATWINPRRCWQSSSEYIIFLIFFNVSIDPELLDVVIKYQSRQWLILNSIYFDVKTGRRETDYSYCFCSGKIKRAIQYFGISGEFRTLQGFKYPNVISHQEKNILCSIIVCHSFTLFHIFWLLGLSLLLLFIFCFFCIASWNVGERSHILHFTR